MKPTWNIHPTYDLPAEFAQAVGGDGLVAQVLYRRGITTAADAWAFLQPERYHPAPPSALPDLDLTADHLAAAIDSGQRILVWGDFDVDGQTATALLLDGLRGLGAEVDFYVPHRLHEGHGIRVDRLAAQLAEKQPDVLLTCDTGISAHDAVEHARSQGLTVLVTDHHDLPPTLPDAHALVNPKRLDSGHPLESLPGVGVVYKLMQRLYVLAGRDPAETEPLLDLVALGIVADVAVQTADTRYLLQRGMDRLRGTERPGLRALMDVAGVVPTFLTTEDIGFQIGPRLNAVGRLGDASQAVELLTTQDSTQAQVVAAQLDGLNKKRQVMQRQMTAAALEMIAAQPNLLDHTALVLHATGWHPGLLGIVAGQLAEKYARPCVMLTSEEGGDLARGSARSAPGYDIGQGIAAQAEILHEFGGHPGAAGASLPVENIDKFRRRLSRTLEAEYRSDAAPSLGIDAVLPLSAITPALVDEINRLAPFGEGNPPVMLAAENVTLKSKRLLGRARRHRKLTVEADGVTREVLWWNGAEHSLPEGRFDFAFTLGWNVYKGQRDIALTLQAIRERERPIAEIAPQRPPRTVEDWRSKAFLPTADVFAQFQAAEPDGVIWAEGLRIDDAPLYTRDDLPPAPALLVYSAPPSSGVFTLALEQVAAQRVYLVGAVHGESAPTGFLQQLLGLVKYTINRREGRADLNRMAAAAGQMVETITVGLQLLAARRTITLVDDGETVILSLPTPGAPDPGAVADAEDMLRGLLAESAAYRAFFSRADAARLVE